MAAMLALAMAACGGETPEAAPDDAGQTTATEAADEPPATPEPDVQTPEPTEAAAVAGDFCDDMSAGLDLWEEFGTQVFMGSSDLAGAVEHTALELPRRLAAARASAPAEMADDVQLLAETYTSLFDDLAGVDASDADAVLDRVIAFFENVDESGDAAVERIEAYVASECGDAVAAADGGAPDPCAFVDAQAVADAAGLGVQMDGGEPAGSFSIPELVTAQCRYDGEVIDNRRVTLTVETMSLSDVAFARQMYADNAPQVIDGVPLGSLPDSTLLTDLDGLRAIYVFEAPTPFGLQVIPGTIEPADLVSAAEEVLAQTR